MTTDLKGNFTFRLGGISANSSTLSTGIDSARTGRAGGATGVYIRELVKGGEIHINVPGYYPIDTPYTGGTNFIGANRAGTLTLKRMDNVAGSSLSATSAAAPSKARKELSKAQKLIEKKKFDQAEAGLQKAVKIYPKYAVAWNLLGQIHLIRNQPEKALEAYSKAVEADSNYTLPYLGRLEIEVGTKQYAQAVQTAETLLALDPTLGTAHFYKAVGYFSLGNREEALRSAQTAVESPHRPPATAHFLLGALLGDKGDHPNAIKHLRLYLTVDQPSVRTSAHHVGGNGSSGTYALRTDRAREKEGKEKEEEWRFVAGVGLDSDLAITDIERLLFALAP